MIFLSLGRRSSDLDEVFNITRLCSYRYVLELLSLGILLFDYTIAYKRDYNRKSIIIINKVQKAMRPLTDQQTKVLFTKLYEYIGDALEYLIKNPVQQSVFRLIKSKVFYINSQLVALSTNVPKEQLLCAGIYIGKFTKTGKFRLSISCLDLMAKYSKHKIWVKTGGEMPFLYGNHVIKAHIARMTENIPQYAPVCIYNLNDLPLGFGVAARGTLQTKDLEPTAVVIFNQADTGEYLRTQDD